MKYKVQVLFMLLLSSLLCPTETQAQASAGQPDFSPNQNGFFVGAAFIYNYSKPNEYYSEVYQNPTIVNTNPVDSIYKLRTRDASIGTFGMHAGYNKPFAKKWSLSFGLELDQYKTKIEYLLYEDGKSNSPDPVSYVTTRYSLCVPFRINYYIGRFIISAGNNIGAGKYTSALTSYNDGSTRQEPYYQPRGVIYIEFCLRESLSYRLLKNKDIYLQLSAGQGQAFPGYSGICHFMAGGSYYF